MAYRIKTEEAFCLECGDMMPYGRKDRKFCCTKCKDDYNNRQRRMSRLAKLRIINALERNYDILDKLLSQGITSVDFYELKVLGYDPDFVTSSRRYKRYLECCCFDIKFLMSTHQICSMTKIMSLPDAVDDNVKGNE